MCQTNNASMEETLRAEVECLRKVLAEKDTKIKHLEELLDNAMAEEPYDRWIKETKEKTGARQ